MKTRIAAILLTLAAAGCVELKPVVVALTSYASATSKVLMAAFQAQLGLCDGPEKNACLDRVAAQWAPIIEASDTLNKAWCAFKPESENCNAVE
jgi:hypothetical protein